MAFHHIMVMLVVVVVVVSGVLAKQHVIRSSTRLKQLGFEEDVNLGELVAEQVVASPAECGRLCKENLACGSVMLMGRLCRMFASVECEVRFLGKISIIRLTT